jgi:mannose-1-phosphate guanylyltransferase
MEHTYPVIMAGGGGTRLWPISRRDRPKQMIPLVEENTLFQSTVQRLSGLFSTDSVMVVTVEEQAERLMEQAPELAPANFLLEPAPRGTASVVGLAAAVLHKRDPQAVMILLPADHYIRNVDLFHLLLTAATDVAQTGYLVTLGIKPTSPATVYGYIQRGQALAEKFSYPAYQVLKFKEKPDEKQARQMLASGDHSWNSGMFIWRADAILAEIGRQMPELKAALDKIMGAWDTPEQEAVLQSVWPGLKNETIDYGIMEKAAKVAVLPASGLEWSDIGNWDSLFDVLVPDENGNIVVGADHMQLETNNTLVYGNNDERMIVTIGVDDMVIVDTGDVLLVCRKDQASKVRSVVEQLKASGKKNFT